MKGAAKLEDVMDMYKREIHVAKISQDCCKHGRLKDWISSLSLLTL